MHGENGDPMPDIWQWPAPVVTPRPPALPLAAHTLDGRGDN